MGRKRKRVRKPAALEDRRLTPTEKKKVPPHDFCDLCAGYVPARRIRTVTVVNGYGQAVKRDMCRPCQGRYRFLKVQP